MKSSRDFGVSGELYAGQYLEKQGYVIINRNYRGDHCEIDLIARRGKILVFVEVKSSRSHIEPETQVNQIKQSHLLRAAKAFLMENDLDQVDCRFDVIALRRRQNRWEINHIEDAFRPEI